MLKRRRQSSPGRPRKAQNKRERLTFTLDPASVSWLKELAVSRKSSTSELLNQLLDRFREESKALPRPIAIPVPREEIAEFCRHNSVARLAFFGSVLTDRFDDDSDIDVLVEFRPGKEPGFFQLADMESELSKILGGRRVDLKTEKELSRYFRDDVRREAELIYAA